MYHVGVILTAQLRTQAGMRQEIPPTKRIEEMASLLKQAESERDALRAQVHKLQAQVDEAVNQGKGLSSVKKDLEHARAAAGLTELQGPGLVITLNDSTVWPKRGKIQTYFDS